LVLTLLLVAWGKGSEPLKERFEQVRGLWPEQETGQTYQGFIKAWRTAGLGPAYAAADQLRRQLGNLAEESGAKLGGWRVLAADGSRFELPRTEDHLRVFGTAGKEQSPQLWVTMLWDLGLGLPWAWKIGRADASERGHLRWMLGRCPAGCLLAMDAGFTGYQLLRQIMAGGRHFLLRVGKQVELLKDLYDVEEKDGRVYLWPRFAQRDQQPPLVLRLIRLPQKGDGRKKMYLLTDVLDKAALSDQLAGEIYAKRWGVELAYRALKQTFEARKLRSHAPVQALLEMHGLLLGLTLLGLWTRRALGPGAPQAKWSPAQALRTVRAGLARPERRQDWLAQLAQARPDGYTRRRKTRVKWPRKKQHDKPPGRPRLRRARVAERRLAAQLRTE
jgi:hypothetical protein